MKKILILLTVALTLFIGVNSTYANNRNCTTAQNWLSFGGFSYNHCPDGLGYPAINAYNNQTIWTEEGPVRKAFEFAFVRKLDKTRWDNYQNNPAIIPSGSRTRGYSKEINLENENQLAQFFLYIHNSGKPICNDTTLTNQQLRDRGCTEHTLARDVRARITSGLTRHPDGTLRSQPGSRHTINFEITSRTSVPRISNSITITTPANKVLVFRESNTTNSSGRNVNNNFREICNSFSVDRNGVRSCNSRQQSSYPASNLLNPGIRVSSTHDATKYPTELLASEGYIVHIYGIFEIQDPPPTTTQACRSLTLTRTTSEIQYPFPVAYDVRISPDNQEFRRTLNYRVLNGPGSNQPTVILNNRVNSTANPAAVVGNWRNGTRVEIFVEGEPNCRQVIQLPVAACTSLSLAPRNINLQAGTAEFRASINSTLPVNEVTRRLNMRNLLNQRMAFTAQPNRNSLGFSQVESSRAGIFRVNTGNYDFTVSEVAAGKSFRMVLPGFEEVCNAEFTFQAQAQRCISFDIERTIQGQESIFRITNLQPPTFTGDIEWSITRPAGGGAFADQRTITQTFVAQNSSLPPGTVVRARLIDPSTGTPNCSGEITIPTGDQVCENISITPRNVNVGDRPNFRLQNIRPTGLGGQVTWQVIDMNNNAARVETRTLGVNQPFTPANNLQNGYEVFVEHESTKDCQDLIRVGTTDLTPGRCERLTLSSNKPFNDNQRDILFTAQTTPGTDYRLFWTLLYEDGRQVDVQTGGYTYTLANPRGVRAVGVGERFDTHLSPCRDAVFKTPETPTPDPDPDPDPDRVCERLTVRNVVNGQVIPTNSPLPTGNRLLNAIVTAEPPEFNNQIRFTVTDQTQFYRENNTFWVRAINDSSKLTIEVPGSQNCTWTSQRINDRDAGTEIELTKEIQDLTRPGTQWSLRNYTFANVGVPIQYRLSVNTNGLQFPTETRFTLNDPIQNGIQGRQRIPNGARIVDGASLGLTTPSWPRPNQNSLNAIFPRNNELIYNGLVTWSNRVQDCNDFTGDCSVQFPNSATLEIQLPTNNTNTPPIRVRSNTAHAIVVCPFVVSRGFGEVFLEQAIPGADLASCGLRNTQSPVFTPAEEEARNLAATGAGESQRITSPTHGICRELAEGNTDVQELLRDRTNIRNFSSATCQTALISAERWQKEQINQSLINTFSRLTNNATQTQNPLNQILANHGNRNRISVSQGLTIGTHPRSTVEIEGSSARTIVVYGDLNIRSNITYLGNSSGVVAFVVIGGDIIIAPGVTEINGIFVTIPHNDAGGSFRWEGQENASEDNWPPEELKPIEIKGSAYGNINHLIQASAGGNLAADRGGVSVLFDGRITRRIPPGLQDVIKFNQFQVATQSLFFAPAE